MQTFSGGIPSIAQTGWEGLPGEEIHLFDDHILALFQQVRPWGLETVIDLADCTPGLIRDSEVIERFVIALCKKIEMQRFGEAQIVHFGNQPHLSGNTLIQLIETSNIAAHFIDQTNAGCINIFSCSPYRVCQAVALCQEWFKAHECQVMVLFRGPRFGAQ
jgi:S-adenosylmethionine/arginine decarboxylase-like enzyme